MTEHVLDHVGIAVTSLDDAIPIWEAIVGSTAHGREAVDSQGVEVVFIGTGPGRVELLAPTRPESPVARFLEGRGQGMHHLFYRVENLPDALRDLESRGHTLIVRTPRTGAGGHQVACVHPRSQTGVLLELLQGP